MMVRACKMLFVFLFAAMLCGVVFCDVQVASAQELPPEGAMAEVNGIEMYYEIQGEGEPLLLIHSAIGNTEEFAAAIPAFLDAGYQTITFDCRGRGRSTDSGEMLSYALMAADTVALMDELGIEKAGIAGQSDGAMIGLYMAVHYPDRVDKLISFGANFNVNGLQPGNIEWLESLTHGDIEGMAGEAYRQIAPDPDYLPALFERLRHMYLTQPDFTIEELMGIQAQVLVFDGEEETTVRIPHAKQMAAAIPNSSMVIVPGAGHGLMFQDLDTYLDYAIPFLAGELDAPPDGRYAAVNDIAMYYEIHGQGEPVVLIHSVTGDMSQFADVVPVLAEEYQVITLDFRGHGQTTDSGLPLSYEQMASDVVALLDHLEIDAAHLVGNKGGGIIGLVMARDYPDRIKSLVAASANWSTTGFQDWFVEYVKGTTLADWEGMTGAMYRELAPDPTIMPVMLEKVRNLLLMQPNVTQEELGQIEIPVLVLAGADEDVLLVEHVQEMAAAIPDAELVLIEGGTHGVLNEEFDAWMGAVGNFLAETAAAQLVPRLEPTECKYSDLEGVDAECSYLVVPEDRSDPDSPTIRVYVIKIAAANPDPAPDPVIVVPGGPGASGPFYAWLYGASPTGQAMSADRDLYILEPRGAMYSEPAFYCPEFEADWTEMVGMSMAEEGAWTQEAYQACHDRLVAEGMNLSAYGFLEIAGDIADLRTALGVDAINVYGISAGTTPAMQMMALYPEGVRSVILDSIYPPDVVFLENVLGNITAAIDATFAACAADPACNAAYPDLPTVFADLLAQLRAAPVPVIVTDDAGVEHTVTVDDLKFVYSVYDSIFIGDGYTTLPANVYAAANGDLSVPASLWLGHSAGHAGTVSAAGGAWARGMTYSAVCLQEGSATDLATATEVYEGVDTLPSIRDWAVTYLLGEWLAPCDYWQVTPPDPNIAVEPVTSDIPTLMLAGMFDPEAPPSLSEPSAARLANSHFFALPAGHGLVFTECGLDLMTRFLADPTQDPDASCIAAMTANWVLPE